MGVRFPGGGTSTRLTNTIITTAETQVITTAPLNISLDFAQIFLFWYIALTIGTAGTAASVFLRRGTLLTSPLINLTLPATAAAGNGLVLTGCYPDTPGAVGAQQYTASVVISNATGNSSITDAAMIAFML